MNPPALKARLLGSPVIVLPMAAVTLWSVYEVYNDLNAWPVTAIIVAVMSMVMKANEQVAAYKSWKAEWDSMAPSSPAPERRPRTGLAVAVAALVAAYLTLTHEQPGHALALGGMATVAIVAVIVAAARRLLRKRRPHLKVKTAPVVALCIRAPLLAVPSLAQAYAALPPHCRRLLNGR